MPADSGRGTRGLLVGTSAVAFIVVLVILLVTRGRESPGGVQPAAQASTAPNMPERSVCADVANFSLGAQAQRVDGKVLFTTDGSVATSTLPLEAGRYYPFVRCERDRTRPASIQAAGQTSGPEYTGQVQGMAWEKFTPLTIRKPGKVSLAFRLGAGARLERVFVYHESYAYVIAKRLPEPLRDEILDDLAKFVRPPGARQAGPHTILDFESEDRDIHCMAWTGRHVWCGFNLNPSRLLRVDRSDLSTAHLEFAKSNGLHALTFDGKWLWAIHYGQTFSGERRRESWSSLSRIDPESMAYETYRIRAGAGGGYCAIFDGKRVWMGLYSSPAMVVAMSREGEELQRIEIPNAPTRRLRALAWDGGGLWVGFRTDPGMLVRIDPKSGAQDTLVLDKGENAVNALSWDGAHLWIGLETRPAIIIRLDPKTGVRQRVALNDGEDYCRQLVFADGSIYAALYCTPSTVVKLGPDMTRLQAWRLGPGEDHARSAVYDGKNLWIGLAMNRWDPGRLWRLTS